MATELGVMPCIDGTWTAVCPRCWETVIWLEQSEEKVRAALESHVCLSPDSGRGDPMGWWRPYA